VRAGRRRLDLALIAARPELSRRRARQLIERGQVLVDGEAVLEAGAEVGEHARVEWDPNRRRLPRRRPALPVLFQDTHLIVGAKRTRRSDASGTGRRGSADIPGSASSTGSTGAPRERSASPSGSPSARRCGPCSAPTASTGATPCWWRASPRSPGGSSTCRSGTSGGAGGAGWRAPASRHGRRSRGGGSSRPSPTPRCSRWSFRPAASTRSASTSQPRGSPCWGIRSGLASTRPLLHAARLAFEHPVTKQRVEATSPRAPDFEAALRRLRRAGRAGPRIAQP